MTNEELVALIQAGTDVTENLGLLYQQNLPLIDKFVTPLANVVRSSAVIDKADLMQEAYFGLVKAANEYDPTKGALFISFAELHIKTALRESKENFIGSKRIPAHMVEVISKYHRFRNKVISESGIEPTQKEMMVALDVKKPKLDAIEKIINELQCISLDSAIPGSDGTTYSETIADDYDLEEAVSDEMTLNYYKKIIWDAVDELSEQQREVIRKHFQEKMTLQNIAEEKHLSIQRICDIQKAGFKLLRKKEKIQEIALEYGYSSYLNYYFGVQRCKDTRSSSTEVVALKRVEFSEQIKRLEERKKEIDSFVFSEEGLKRLKEQSEERMKNINASFEALKKVGDK